MEPFLQYGWQPQVMVVDGRYKVIHAGKVEVYDVVADPAEAHDLAASARLSRDVRKTIREYPLPSLEVAASDSGLTDEERKKLASLGYLAAETKPVIRSGAPRPRDLEHLFQALDEASTLFVREEYGRAIPMLEQILSEDPHNLAVALRLAAAHSRLGNDAEALAAFRKAEAIAPQSGDVRHYLALHYAKGKEWQRAVPLLERVLRETPDRLPAIEALANLRERQGRLPEAAELLQKVHAMRTATPSELIHLGALAMRIGNTPVALESFQRAREVQGRHSVTMWSSLFCTSMRGGWRMHVRRSIVFPPRILSTRWLCSSVRR